MYCWACSRVYLVLACNLSCLSSSSAKWALICTASKASVCSFTCWLKSLRMLWKFITVRKELDSCNHMCSCHFLSTDSLPMLATGKALRILVIFCLPFPLVYSSYGRIVLRIQYYIFVHQQITQIVEHQNNRSILARVDSSVRIGVLSWTVDFDLYHPKVTHP